MIKIEVLENGLIHTYSDNATKQLQKVGTDEVYSEALDVPNAGYEYIEIDALTPETQEEVQPDE